MIKRFASLLRRIVGRIKEYMNLTALSATLGVMALPLGIYLLVEGRIEDRWFAYGMFLTGILLLIVTMLRVWMEEKRDKWNQKEQDRVEYNRFEVQAKLLVEILKELKKMNKRGKANGKRTNT